MSRPKDMTPLEEKLRRIYLENEGGCWECQYGFNSQGYGYIYHNGKTIGAHRVSWELHNSPIPKGMLVRHKCDNPSCVNPEHLELGTYADNARDTVERRRTLSGERNKFSRLTTTEVLEIRARASAGDSTKDIAAQYGMSVRAMNDIISRHTWKNV